MLWEAPFATSGALHPRDVRMPSFANNFAQKQTCGLSQSLQMASRWFLTRSGENHILPAPGLLAPLLPPNHQVGLGAIGNPLGNTKGIQSLLVDRANQNCMEKAKRSTTSVLILRIHLFDGQVVADNQIIQPPARHLSSHLICVEAQWKGSDW